ncbi:MFS transporter [Roseomonas sp. USHLN139]|uniref:MFS transporter n=1 Tax=Roseomonas sp. USHLN139 TaxID=3081298 RepID=UPI003B01CE47
MPPSPFPSLLGAAAGLHAADQLAVAALPLAVVLGLGGDAGLLGRLLALQGLAWLVWSLPAGLLVDRWPRRRMLALAAAAAAAGLALSLAGLQAGQAWLLGLGSFAGASGTALFVLAAGAAVPALVPPAGRRRANARLELARALVTLAAPVAAGALAARGALPLAYALGLAGALLALAGALLLPASAAASAPAGGSPLAQLRDGAGFLLRHPLLRAIGLCALFWNMGFFALLTAFVPFALGPLGLLPGQAGLAQAGLGAGLLAGAALAPWCLARFGDAPVLLQGPALSALAPALLLAAPAGTMGLALALLAQFLVGFGPMLWLVCQMSIRQALVPPALLGRVGAVLQLANYGVRPFGALAAGWLAASSGPAAGLGLALACFGASLLVIGLAPARRSEAAGVEGG